MNRAECFCLIALTAQMARPQGGVGAQNQIFTIPPGWTRTEMGPSVIVTPNSAPKNTVSIFLSGRPLSGASFRDAFDADYQGLNAGLRVVNASAVQSLKDASGIEQFTIAVELRNANGVPFYRHYVAAGPPGRIEMLVYSATSSALFGQYRPDFERFVSGWTARVNNSETAGMEI